MIILLKFYYLTVMGQHEDRYSRLEEYIRTDRIALPLVLEAHHRAAMSTAPLEWANWVFEARQKSQI